MSMTTRITAFDGTDILTRRWEAAGTPRAGILIVHGLGEHSGRYEHVGAALAGRGFAVHAFDLPGFGSSGGARAYVDRFDVYLDHVAERLGDVAGLDAPTVLFGHSLGGLIGLAYAISRRTSPSLLAVSAPVLDADVPVIKKVAARVLSRVAPKLSLPNDIMGEQLSRDPKVGEAYFADPLVCTKTTTRLGAEFLAVMQPTTAACKAGLPVPTLVIHGAEDTLVPPASGEFLDGVPGVKRIVFPEFRHEPHNEDGGAVMVDTLAGWIDRNLA